MDMINKLIKLETKIIKNKYGLDFMLGVIEIAGRKYIPHFTTSFLTFNMLKVEFVETDKRKKSKIWSKKQENTRNLILSCIDNSTYKTRIVEGKDLLKIDKVNDKEILDKYYELYSECFKFNFGYDLGKRKSNEVLLLDLEAFRIVCTQFKFSDTGSNGSYRQKKRERAIYFESIEAFVKEFFNTEILVHDWLYITPQQVGYFMNEKEEVIDILVGEHNKLYIGDGYYKSKFGMFFSESDLRENEIEKLIQFYIEDVFCSENELSYYKITYKSYTGFLEFSRQIKDNEINYKSFLIDLIDIYKTIKRIVKYSGKKIYEHHCVENDIYGEKLENTMAVESVYREIDENDKKYSDGSLRHKTIIMREHNSKFYNEYSLMGEEEFKNKFDNCIVSHFMNRIKEYHKKLRDLYSYSYDINDRDYANNKIKKMTFSRYLRFYRQYTHTYLYEYNENLLKLKNEGKIDSFDYAIDMYFLKEEYETNRKWFEDKTKEEFMKLRNEVIEMRSSISKLSVYTDEFMEDPAILTTKPKSERERSDISYLFLHKPKEYKTKPRHINRLLEED